MGELKQVRTDAEAALIAAWDRAPAQADWRKAAFARFAMAGLPHRRIESWHYTDLRGLLRTALPTRAPDSAAVEGARARLAALRIGAATRLVVLDGAFRPDLSDMDALPEGVAVQSLAAALVADDIVSLLAPKGLGDDDSIVALNAAMMQDGVVVRIAPGAVVERNIALVTLMSGGAPHAAFVRSLVDVGAGARARIVEIADSPVAEIQSHDALVLRVGEGAELEHVAHVGYEGAGAMQLHSLLATLQRDATFNSFCLVADGGLVRRQIFAHLDGERATLGLRGLSLLRGREHADTTLVVDHALPYGVSREFYRHILDGEATGVYQGQVCVRQHAQKTDGAMKSQALVLAEGAAMYNKPELEIFADDVVCGHGATVGALNEDQLFYLRARGHDKVQAEKLLLEAFAAEVIDEIGSEAMRDALHEAVQTWLRRRG